MTIRAAIALAVTGVPDRPAEAAGPATFKWSRRNSPATRLAHGVTER